MNKEIREIINGVKRAIVLMHPSEKNNLIVAAGIMIVTGFLTNLPAVILGRLVDNLVNSQKIRFDNAFPYISLIVVIILVREVLTVIRKYIIENIATKIDKEQTVSVIERLLKTDISGYLQKTQIGSLHGRIFRSMQGLIRIIKLTFLDFTPLFFSAVAAIVIALFQKPIIGSVMILVIPTGLYLIAKQISSQKGIRVSLLRGKEEIDGRVVEMLSGIETIRVLNTTSLEIEKVEEIAEKQRATEIRHHIQMALFDAVKYLNEGFFYVLVIILSIYFASIGIISTGDILVYSILFMSIVSPLREIHRILDQAHESSIQVNDLYELLHQPLDESYTNPRSEKGLSSKTTAVQMRNLSFSYADKNNGILDDLTINIKNGEKIGICGSSGCGKSTFVRLILKLIHGYSGEVNLFGKNLLDITRAEIAEKIVYVPQKPFIFSGTIRDNITYGVNRTVDDLELIKVAKNSQLYDEINKSLGGFNGKVSESGNNLSGGQRQRLAIARIMLKSPEIIVLDEATSALDNTNEAAVLKNLEKIFSDKTMIIIAHRLTTLRNCDRIFVFDKGKIAQMGKYGDLSKAKGLFQDFLNLRDS